VARTRRRLRPATGILNIMSGFLIISTVLHFLVFMGDRPLAKREAPAPSPVIEVEDPLPIEVPPEASRPTLPNIYYIVPDAYARADVLAGRYGWDNAAFLDGLRQKGFYVASRSSANYDYTTASVACALNLAYLDALAAREGASSRDVCPLRRKVLMSRLVEFLKRCGYKTVSFPSGYWGVDMKTADHYITPARDLTEFQAALLGETAMAPLLRALDWLAPVEAARAVLGPHVVHRARVLHALDHLVDTCDMDGPVFVFAHLFPPHPPFVFGPDGEPRQTSSVYGLSDGRDWHERTGGSVEQYMRGYRDQVAFVNARLAGVIEALLARSRRPPVIVVMSDHGPRSSPDEEDFSASANRERLGILAACHLPEGDEKQLYDTISPVNVFRVVLNHTFDARLPLLPDRHYRSRPGRPYDFVDVTGRAGGVSQGLRPEQ
jgi:hypothetical protein